MSHVMVDIETLGTKPGSVILSIGACRFDEDGVGGRFYRAIDVFDSLMHGLKVDEATVGFWRLQSPEARGVLKPAHYLLDVLADFADFYKARAIDEPPPCLWAKGPDFDLVMLEAAYAAAGQKKPWSYRAARDVRTVLALGRYPSVPVEGTKHNALDDAVNQANQVRAAAAEMRVELA